MEPNCNEDYLGETGRIIIERTADHCGKDKQSHLLKHAQISNHPVVDLKDLKVIDQKLPWKQVQDQRLNTLSSADHC